MATFMEMLDSGFFLIVNTVILITMTLTAGTILDWLAVWSAEQPGGLLSPTPIMYTFGSFYGMIALIEAGLFVQLFLTIIKKTNYQTGETEF